MPGCVQIMAYCCYSLSNRVPIGKCEVLCRVETETRVAKGGKGSGDLGREGAADLKTTTLPLPPCI